MARTVNYTVLISLPRDSADLRMPGIHASAHSYSHSQGIPFAYRTPDKWKKSELTGNIYCNGWIQWCSDVQTNLLQWI